MEILDRAERVMPRVKFTRPSGAKGPGRSRTSGFTAERWMISYVDVLTILFVLFVGIAAKQGQTARTKDIVQTPPTPLKQQLTPLRDPLLNLEERLRQVHVESHRETRGLVISLPQAILFATGDDQITNAALPVVRDIAAILKSVPNRISLEGHADPTPIHNQRFENNWALAAARGLRLLNVLSKEYEIVDSRLSIASYGSTEPRDANDTEQGRAANRRVEIIVLAEAP